MNKEEFDKYVSDGYTQIPVYEEFVADLISPLYVFSNYFNLKNTFLFESAKSHEVKGRYSIMSLQSLKRYNFFNNEVEIITKEKTERRRVPDPFKYLDNLINEFNAPTIKGLPNFLGGLIGYFSYESFNFIEPKLNLHSPDIPFISICQCNEIIVFDNFKGTFYIIVTTEQKTDDGYQSAKRRIKEIKSAIYSLQPSISQNINRVDKELVSTTNPDEKTFKSYVKKIKSLINDGEIMQAVLSREVSFKGNFNPFTLYRALRLINPSPYMFYMNFGDLNLIGSSPEILVQNFQDKVTIRPIAGTRKRGIDESEDLQNKIDLIGDDKEKAEHMMLVDLARNDVSKVSNPSTVSVDEMMVVEKYSHVMHMTSNVIGQIKESATPIDCLKAALPAGTLSGAPKIRAMEILSELENRARGIYGGCVGYIGYNKSLDTAIIIRTALHKKDEVKVGVGAGIVFDSEPQNEWNETVAKLNVFLEALKYE